ncbi:hypothetical protein [Sphingomonas hankyongi]|uniref:Uncharacterized protein n=1 Tax=Sphingomonas hankyongi TaxID=2908209 RepID=A0ABT0S1U0_9SPHN|nr:hypothetical protein [Sphingomonas hankyongi]MCL6729781.1 hypothetical protein [Sphingomonas hankyongi]
MDFNSLRRRHQLSLMKADASLTPDQRLAHEQFADDYARQVGEARAARGAAPALPGSIT